MRGYRVVVASLVVVAGCGGGKPPPAKPPPPVTKLAPPPETEADREHKRHALATAMVPEGSTCLPAALKDDGAPRLELAAVGKDAIVCAVDTDKSRLLGAVACWKVDLGSGALAYQDAAPLPGHNLDVTIDDRCMRGYCVPKEAKVTTKIAHMSWNLDSTKVAVLLGDDIHIFDGASKAHESSFSVRGDKGLTNDPIAVYFIGDVLFVEGSDAGPYSAVWMFKTDGSQVGPINALGGKDEKPLSTFHGSFSILDPTHVAIAERGMETLTTYEIETGKRTKAVRKVGKSACKPDELDGFWHDNEKVTDKCKDSMMKLSGHLIGATAVMGKSNLLVLLRNSRLGELGVIDPRSLTEKKSIKLQWCGASTGADDAKPGAAAPSEEKESKTRGATVKSKSGDPEEGGR